MNSEGGDSTHAGRLKRAGGAVVDVGPGGAGYDQSVGQPALRGVDPGAAGGPENCRRPAEKICDWRCGFPMRGETTTRLGQRHAKIAGRPRAAIDPRRCDAARLGSPADARGPRRVQNVSTQGRSESSSDQAERG
ncbi:hypothetical protein GCM10008024_04690 [Allgaiera indica]|uniref:Uncharacterized protein n=1 Tax=Allgaiera indica TaxID=765699 RepID=A0AAN4UNQ3_9RHOB|nr:hypothetical protein GCM10008024_04690 [Allgaiera indica]